MNLLDMINFTLASLVTCLTVLIPQEIRAAMHYAAANREAVLDGEDKERVEANLTFIAETCQKLLLQSAENRLGRIFTSLRLRPFPYWELANELNILSEAINDDIKTEYFYHYPRQKALMLLMVRGEWAAALGGFPSIESEVTAGVDCYAIGHNIACVFHMCRVAEVGLRAIAKERGVTTVRRNTPIAWGTWGDVFTKIDLTLRAIQQARAGSKKDEALAFYNVILSDLRAIQDLYRNKTMHLRDRYNEGQAQSAMIRTRHLMETLASRLAEPTIKRIRWGIR
jgi:hypothetical protein